MTAPTYDKTLAFIRKAHGEQTDKAGRPYWEHPWRVSEIVARMVLGVRPEPIAALLHDVVEDTSTTLFDLRAMGYPPEVVDAVALLTREPGVTYMGFINGLARSGNACAIRVKLADLEDNLDPDRVSVLPDWHVDRYRRARAILDHALRALEGGCDEG